MFEFFYMMNKQFFKSKFFTSCQDEMENSIFKCVIEFQSSEKKLLIHKLIYLNVSTTCRNTLIVDTLMMLWWIKATPMRGSTLNIHNQNQSSWKSSGWKICPFQKDPQWKMSPLSKKISIDFSTVQWFFKKGIFYWKIDSQEKKNLSTVKFNFSIQPYLFFSLISQQIFFSIKISIFNFQS